LPTTRLNDGKTDRAGQFLFASMGVTDRTQGWGGLYRLRREAPGTGWASQTRNRSPPEGLFQHLTQLF